MPFHIKEITNIFCHGTLICVFRSDGIHGPEWTTQSLAVPIPISRETRVLIRDDGFCDADCLNMQLEINQHLSVSQGTIRGAGTRNQYRHINVFTSPNELATKQPPNPSSVTPDNVPEEASFTATSLSQQARAPVGDKSAFPLRYTADMVPRLERI